MLGGKVTYEAVAEAHGLDYTPLDDALRLALEPGSGLSSSRARADPDDQPGDACGERDHAGDEDGDAEESERGGHGT